jgi:hypothetical protein
VNREGSPLRVPGADAGGPYDVNEGATSALSGAGTPPADHPWVELYDDEDFEDRSIVVDYDDRALLELNEFDALDDFGDNTSSVRWRSPVGVDIQLFDDDDFGDRWIVLRGTGRTEAIADLNNQVVVPGLVEHFNPTRGAGETLFFGGRTSSLRWVGDPAEALAFAWDLDGDAVFGETGGAAARGDETGPSPTFVATALDGPLDLAVTLRVTAAGALDAGQDIADVHVLNVAPAVTIDVIDGGLPGLALIGLPVQLSGRYADIPADTHTAQVDWRDGTVSAGTVDAPASTVTATHVYTTPGAYDVILAVTDDDLGTGTGTEPLTVHDPASAVAAVIATIDVLLQTTLDPNDRGALLRARELLAGRHAGQSSDGAIDKLAGGQSVAALVMIEEAIQALARVAGLDVTSLERLLALAANAVARAAREDLAASTSNQGGENRLAQVDTWLADGESKLAAEVYADAVRSFRFATARAQGFTQHDGASAGAGAAAAGEAVPTRFDLRIAGASPAYGRVHMRLAVPVRSAIRVDVFDVRGALVRSLAASGLAAGWHALDWDGRDAQGQLAPAGVYFISLKSGRDQVTARVPILR